MKRRKLQFKNVEPWPGVGEEEWSDWKWQHRHSLSSLNDFSKVFQLNSDEVAGFEQGEDIFRVRTTPYYASLLSKTDSSCSLRRMTLPSVNEVSSEFQQMFDPLGEHKKSNRVGSRLIHRYTDRVLFLVTDMCGIYCRYCTRKNFTASDQVMANPEQLTQAIEYVKKHPEVKEVIFSGGWGSIKNPIEWAQD